MTRSEKRKQARLLKNTQNKDPRYNKNLLIKMVDQGKAPIECLDPPTFKIALKEDGEMHYTIDGKHVDKKYFFSERDRLHVSPFAQEFNIECFRGDETKSGR